MSALVDTEHSAFMKYINDKIGDESPSLKRQMSLSPDSEVRTIMQKRTTTPRVDIINRGSSTRLTPQEVKKDVRNLDKRQNEEISGMRHRSASVYAKRARELQEKIEEIDLLISEAKEEKNKNKINVLEQKKKELQLAKKAKEAAVSFSYRGTRRKRSQSIGGKTRKKLRNKRKSRSKKSLFKKKRTKKRRKRRKRRTMHKSRQETKSKKRSKYSRRKK